jgi:hypothetical protein
VYAGQFQFVYVTPEYASTRSTEDLAALHGASKFCLIALDEAHCVSDWGKGYRAASYSQLHKLRAPGSPLAALPWVAVTATATPRVQVRASSMNACSTVSAHWQGLREHGAPFAPCCADATRQHATPDCSCGPSDEPGVAGTTLALRCRPRSRRLCACARPSRSAAPPSGRTCTSRAA